MVKFLQLLSVPWVGTVLGLCGVVLAVYFYLRAKKVVRISYEIAETVVVGTPDASLSDDLSVSFQGVGVPRVTATKITIWNSGNSTIRSPDIADGDPLALILPDAGQFLQSSILGKTRPVNNFSAALTAVPNVVLVDFDFLDPNDGASISLLHTASPGMIGIKGTVIGLRGGLTRVSKEKGHWLDKAIFVLIVMVPTAVFSSALAYIFPDARPISRPPMPPPETASGLPVIALVTLIILVVFFSMLLAFAIKLVPQRFGWRRAPKELG